jgi:hypothetical protein
VREAYSFEVELWDWTACTCVHDVIVHDVIMTARQGNLHACIRDAYPTHVFNSSCGSKPAVTSLLALITSGLDDTGIRNTPPAQETKLQLSNVTLRGEKHDGTILVQRVQSKSNYGTQRNNDSSEKVLECIGPYHQTFTDGRGTGGRASRLYPFTEVI